MTLLFNRVAATAAAPKHDKLCKTGKHACTFDLMLSKYSNSILTFKIEMELLNMNSQLIFVSCFMFDLIKLQARAGYSPLFQTMACLSQTLLHALSQAPQN